MLDYDIDTDEIHTYVKVIAPFDTLCEEAQKTRIKIRINVSENSFSYPIYIFDKKY